jgi:hypothetical protein
MRRLTVWPMLGLVFLLGAGPALGQSVQIATSAPGPLLQTVLVWPSSSGTTRFNLYRKLAGAHSFPVTPINGSPIAVYTSCPAIQAVVPPNSAAWNALAGITNGNAAVAPCAISTIPANSQAESQLELLAQSQWQIAVVAGLGYVDSSVSAGVRYTYQLHGVDARGADTGSLFSPVSIRAGAPVSIPAPASVVATAGDSRILLLWNDRTGAAGYFVYRATAAAGPYQRVNANATTARFTADLNGTALPQPSDGFLDMLRWTPEGEPTTHLVNGVAISGPLDGTTYYYKVVSTDLLGRAGPMPSVPATATPVDTTPPMTPVQVTATAIDPQKQIEIRWAAISLDVAGHVDSSGVAKYRLYRYLSENAVPGSGLQIGPDILAPPAGTTFASATDSSQDLLPPYGEQTYWYRVQAADNAGNLSGFSSAVGAHLKDLTPPAPPTAVAAQGFDVYIDVTWAPNTEPDLDGYDVYRSLCSNGICNPCTPSIDQIQGAVPPGRIPCTGPYALIGTIASAGAVPSNQIEFKDRTIPAGSPLCYSYWIRAFDKSQNRSGGLPGNPEVPGPLDNTVCQRLRDTTPPDPAIITGLNARNNAVQVEWIGPPVQDVHAYHVYRSQQEAGSYTWVGGVTVPVPPSPPQVLTSPYQAPPTIGCDKIPMVSNTQMSLGAFVDRTALPKTIYWYKVVGIDWSGNEAPLSKAVAMSTFTYTSVAPPAPAITSIAATASGPVGLIISWSPVFDPSTMKGFVVFRSSRQNGVFRQIGTLLQANQYVDTLVVRGAAYWYKVVEMDVRGQVSAAPTATSGSLAP